MRVSRGSLSSLAHSEAERERLGLQALMEICLKPLSIEEFSLLTMSMFSVYTTVERRTSTVQWLEGMLGPGRPEINSPPCHEVY